MDGECAFCGRAEAASHQMFCQDCRTHHRVCRACADDAAAEADTLGLELAAWVSPGSNPFKVD